MGKIARAKAEAIKYAYVEGIGIGGYGFDHTGDYWNNGEYLTHVKHFEGRFQKSNDTGLTNFVRWTKEIAGDYKYFYETPQGAIFEDSDVEWVDDPNVGIEASVTVSDGS